MESSSPTTVALAPILHRTTCKATRSNGVFIRIDTQAGGRTRSLEVPARFDDTDIVYVLGDSLLLIGEAGGPFEESNATRPPIDSITSQSTVGSLAAGTYFYSYTYVCCLWQ